MIMQTIRSPRYIGLTLILLALTTLTVPATAMPPYPDIQEKIDKGEIARPFVKASVYGLDSDPINAPAKVNTPQVAGPFRALCLLVDFSDNSAVTTPFKFDTLIFAARTGTVRDYYDEVSYGQIDLVTVNLPSATGWGRAPQSYAYYTYNGYGTDSPYPHNSQKLCEDLVDLANTVVDYSQYDNNGDGYVDALMIVHAGPGAEFTGDSTDIWSHKWSISPRYRDGVAIYDYAIMPEFWSAPGDMTIGVFCHELGHVLGLPDLYDTDYSSRGVGQWSLMSTGSWNGYLGSSPAHPDAWCKARLGWLAPTTVSANQTGVSIAAAESNPVAYRLWTAGAPGNQYFLVENRQKSGYDATLTSSGLLIWHVDDGCAHNDYEWYPGHSTFGHLWVALEQADNQFQLEKNTSNGDAGDPFPGSTGNMDFSPTSAPNSDSYSASSSYVAVTNISPSAAIMTADFTVSLSSGNDEGTDNGAPLPELYLGQNYPNPFNPTTSFSYTVGKPGNITITVYNILGEYVTCLASGHHDAGAYTVVWDGTAGDGQAVASGIYLYELSTDEDRQVRKMMLLK